MQSLNTFRAAAMAATMLVGIAANTADAATVTYKLVVNDNGTGAVTPNAFAVYASDSLGDNFGLASFGVDLSGTSTVSNQSPRQNYTDGESVITAGFTLLRSSNTNNSDPAGSQDTITPQNAVIVYGFGQTSGNLSTLTPSGFSNTAPATRVSYTGAPLLLATGTYADASLLGFTPSSVTTFANVFNTSNGTTTVAASVATQVVTNVVVPEPTTLGLLAAGSVGLLARRRKTA